MFKIKIIRPVDGPYSGKYIVAFLVSDTTQASMVFRDTNKNEMLTLFRKAGRVSREHIDWTVISGEQNLIIDIPHPAKWFWSELRS